MNSARKSLAAERDPEPVGIGEGGGAGMVNWLLVRIIAIDANEGRWEWKEGLGLFY